MWHSGAVYQVPKVIIKGKIMKEKEFLEINKYYEKLTELRMGIFNKISKSIKDNDVNEAFKWGEVLARTKEL